MIDVMQMNIPFSTFGIGYGYRNGTKFYPSIFLVYAAIVSKIIFVIKRLNGLANGGIYIAVLHNSLYWGLKFR
jgi:hypothetical protein